MDKLLKKFIAGAVAILALCVFDIFYYIEVGEIPFGEGFFLVHLGISVIGRIAYSLFENHAARKQNIEIPFPRFRDFF